MEWILCLGHALLGVLLLPFAFAPETARRRAIEAASAAGVGLGVALVVAGEKGVEPWRTVAFEPATAAPAGLAVAAGWLVAGALAGRRPRPEETTLLGVASSALVLAVTGRYVVPALIFWLCASAALAAATRSRWTWAVLAASDAAFCAAALAHARGDDTWAFEGVTGTIPLAGLAVAAVVRGGGHLGGGPAAPLMAGAALALVARTAGAEPWVALALLVAALSVAVAGVVWNRMGPQLVAAWVATLALAVCFAEPGLAPVGGAAAVLAAAAAALWPYTAGRGGVARALTFSAMPLTAGFVLVAGGAAEAFVQASAGSDALAWTMLAALLPAALAFGVVLGGRAARTDAGDFVPEAVLATWLLSAGAVAIGVLPRMVGDASPLGDSGGAVALQAAALAAGVAAGAGVRSAGVDVDPPYSGLGAATPAVLPELPAAAVRAILVLAAATVAASAWLTIAGLRVGFL